MSDVTYRLAIESDLPHTSRVFKTAVNELYTRRNVRLIATPDTASIPFHRHLLCHDRDRFWIAEHARLPVGFACGLVRGEWWFLSTLFILPEFQAQGIGRALLERAKAGYPTPSGIAATMTDALQPKSNTLYARHGMFPRLPAVVFTGPLRPGLERPRLGNLEVRPLTLDDLPALLQIDADVTGLDRTPDHASYLGEAEWPGWLFSRAGQPTGYTYIRPGGAIGPAATVRSGDMERVMQYALVEVAAYQPAAVRVIVPGPNTAAQRPLWAAGLVFDEVPGLILMSRPFGHFDRYVCASFGMM